MLAVTSFNPERQEYGAKCLKTLAEYFPGKVVAFIEGHIEVPGVEVRDFWEIPGVKEYLEKCKRVAGSDGMFTRNWNYRFDAQKFCRKVFAQDQAFDMDSEVFWVDADCELFSEIPEQFLRDMIKDVPFAFYGRRNYTETGFIGFNTVHPDFKKFRSKYLSHFTTGRIFQEKEWHDCIAFDVARKGIKGNNLSPTGEAMGHVILLSPLAKYLDHKKGPQRKSLGYSPGHPISDPCARAANGL